MARRAICPTRRAGSRYTIQLEFFYWRAAPNQLARRVTPRDSSRSFLMQLRAAPSMLRNVQMPERTPVAEGTAQRAIDPWATRNSQNLSSSEKKTSFKVS
ncbi:hypothetical protein A2U01_0067393 [Trifolium medium]|uniref:Uncharacterized protein n=1 Tax=Trifolium medium TaxID=97028 RepID=A0A392SB24_9FABA|nr:hypothetical protein [Trifolium medium]